MTTKNIQVIDGACNSTYDVFEVPEYIFDMLFPEETDVAFLSEVEERIEEYFSVHKIDEASWWGRVYASKVDKKRLIGIHGTLHLTGSIGDHNYFLSRKEQDVQK